MDVENEKLWMVKSSGRILGPYTKSEISDLLRTREVVVLDEVLKPTRRWMHIRDEAAFAKIVEELRHENLHEKTDDTTAEMGSSTVSSTEPIDQMSDDLTEEIGINLTQDAEFVELSDIPVNEKKEESKPRDGYASYGLSSDPNVKKRAQKSTQLMWVLTLVIIFGVVGFIGYKQYVIGPQQQQKISADYVTEGKEALMLGRYQEALQSFKKANTLAPNNTNIYVYLGPLLIQLEGQTVMGKRMLTMALESEGAYKLQAWTGIGLAEMANGDLSRAEQAFDRALQLDPTYFPALINLGVIAQNRGEHLQSKNYLRAAVDKGATEGEAYLLLAQSHIYQAESENTEEELSQAQQVIQDYLESGYDYLQEANFLSSYISFLNKDFQRADLKINNLLDVDPQLTQDHYHTLFTNKERTSWEHFLKWCQQMTGEMPASARISGLQSLCLLNAGQKMEAKKVIDAAVAQEPKDPLVQALYAHVLQKNGLNEESSVALGKASQFDVKNEYKLPLILQARFCQEQGDWACAQENWTDLLSIDSASLPAIVGLAQVHFKNQDLSEAEKLLQRGLKLSPQYKPLMQLKATAKAQGWLKAND